MKKHALVKGIVVVLLVATIIFGAGCQGTGSSANSTAAATVATTAAAAPTAAATAGTAQGAPAGGQAGTPPGDPPSGSGSGSGSGSTAVAGTAAVTQSGGTASKDNAKLSSSAADQSVLMASNGGTLTATGSTITKTGDASNVDNSNFYGINAGVLAEAGSMVTLKDCSINTSSSGSNAAFATGTGATVNLDNVTINTTSDSSRGLDVTLGGAINATNTKITTAGAHCAAIASDRGGGTVTVTGGTMNTAGEGSPGIYSTANITVSNATLTATGSEAAVIEGKNSITLTDVTLSGAKKHGVMLYQSFSGDADVGTSSFSMTGGALTALEGPLFYITNTDSVVNLTGATLTQSSGTLLAAAADSWGTKGSNGGKVAFTASKETLTGNVTCDAISSITLSLKDGTTLAGAIDTQNTAGTMALTLDSTSVWTVTGTSYLTALTDADTTLANIHSGGNTVYYDAANSANSWLAGKTIALAGGGSLTPAAK